MSLTANSTTVYARRYDVTRDGVAYWIDLDLRAEWREIPGAGTYTVIDRDNPPRRISGPWHSTMGLSGPAVLDFFTRLLDNALGTTAAIAVNGSTDYATEHDVTYNPGDATEAGYLIRLDIIRDRRVLFDANGAMIDSGKWRVNAMSGPAVVAFFETVIHAATGVAPV